MDDKDFKQKFQKQIFNILEQISHGIVITDASEDNLILYVNKAFSEIFDYAPHECIGQNCRFLQQDDRDQENLQLVREAIQNKKPIQTVLRNYTKDGKLIYNEVKITPIFGTNTNEVEYFIGIQKDLSDRHLIKHDIILEKKNEKLSSKDYDVLLQELNIYQTELLAQNDELIIRDRRLETLNQEFSSLFQDAPIAYLVIDKNLEVKRYNKVADEYFHFSSFKTLKTLFPIIKEQNLEKLIAWLSTSEYKKSNLEIDILCENKKISNRFELYAKNYVIDPEFLLISLNNIQESYEIKTMLEKKVEEELAKIIEQEKFILNQAKFASMGEMIDAIAHQWLNPLSSIKLFTQVNKMELETFKEQNEIFLSMISRLEKTEEHINHLVDTLQEFRSFFRPDEDLEEVYISDIVNSCLTLMKDELIKATIETDIQQDENFKIRVIKNQFKHVFINLLSNSKDAFEENSIKKRKVSFKYYSDEEYYIVEYKDNAGGIPLNVIENIFEANFTTKEKGTGIGLYLSKQILDKFNISIDVRSEGESSFFTIKYAKTLNI